MKNRRLARRSLLIGVLAGTTALVLSMGAPRSLGSNSGGEEAGYTVSCSASGTMIEGGDITHSTGGCQALLARFWAYNRYETTTGCSGTMFIRVNRLVLPSTVYQEWPSRDAWAWECIDGSYYYSPLFSSRQLRQGQEQTYDSAGTAWQIVLYK